MKINRVTAVAGAVIAVSGATFASAQTGTKPAAPATAQTPPPVGAPLPGICVLSIDQAIYTSTVGKAMVQRLSQLDSQAGSEVKDEQTAVQADAKTLEAQRPNLTPDQYQQRGGQLQARWDAAQRKGQIRQQELQLTEEKAQQRFNTEMDPIVRQIFVQRSCSILINARSLIYPTPAMDITQQVVQGLNARIQSFPFDREHLDIPAQPAAGPSK
jgi:Skp family chaperone for outer membrane proteins